MSQEYYNHYNQPENNDQNNEVNKPPKKSKAKVATIIGCSALGGALLTTIALSSVFNLNIFSKPNQGTALAGFASEEQSANVNYQSSQNKGEQLRTLPQLGGTVPSYIGQSTGISDVAAALIPSIVRINVTAQSTNPLGQGQVITGGGSGIIISQDGYIVTNNHVIEDAQSINVIFEDDDSTQVAATVIGSDPTIDIAVIKVEKTNLTPAAIGESSELKVGESVIAIGNPLGSLGGSVTAGIISAIDRSYNIDGTTVGMIQTDAAINPGNSGGALVNMGGEIIGINTVKTITAGQDSYGNTIAAEGIGFAIPMKVAMPVVRDLIQYGKVNRPGIGITGQTISLEQAQNWDTPRGVLVRQVTLGGSAQVAGIKENDIITKIDGAKIADMDALSEQIKSKKIGDSIKLNVWRETGEIEVSVTVNDMNDMNKAAAQKQKEVQSAQPSVSSMPGLEEFPWSYFFR